MRSRQFSHHALACFCWVVFVTGSLFAAPTITSISPTSGPTYTTVTIQGSGFGTPQGTSTVTIAGFAMGVTIWGDTSITAVVPSFFCVDGPSPIVVTVGGVASNPVNFTATNPLICSFSINSAPVDQEITLTGINFGSSQGTSTLAFNGTLATPSSWGETSIVTPVPAGATTGNVVVTVNGVASRGAEFMVVPGQQPPGVHFMQGNYLAVGSSSRSVFTLPFPVEQTANDLNVVVVSWKGTNSITSVVDTVGNTYVLALAPTVGTSQTLAIYYAKSIFQSVNNSVTVTYSTAASCPDIRIAEYSGLDTSSPVDVAVGAYGTSGTSNSGNLTTTNANDLLIASNAITLGNPTTGPGANYTNRVITYGNSGGDILEDQIVTSIGTYNATASLGSNLDQWVMQLVAFKEAQNQAPVVNAGPNQTITLPVNTVQLDGTATDDGLPNNTLIIAWTKVSGPGTVTFSSPSTAISQATFSAAGVYVLQLSANDTQLTSTSNVTITVNPEPISLVLSPAMAGPDVIGTSQTMTAVLTAANTGNPITGASVSFTVTGPNATSGNGTTNSSGIATFSYSGSKQGTDTVQATYSGQNSNSANVSWLVPKQTISTSTVFGQFFFPDNPPGYVFDISPSTKPVFTQTFPSIAFNPPSGAIPGNNSVSPSSRPFTNVTMDGNGNFTGGVVAQGGGYQAGVGSLQSFEAVFTGSYTVAGAGNATITIYVDNSFILGVGGGATRVSGPLGNNPPPSTPFEQFPVIASAQTTIGGFAITINFPTAGTYPFELDYVECCSNPTGDLLSLVMMTGSSGNGIAPGMPPTGSLSLTPINPPSLTTGQVQTFTVQAVDGSGAPVSNLNVGLLVSPSNILQLSATTNAAGQATFQYTGHNAGIDSVQADANISSALVVSNVVNVPWSLPSGGGGGGCSTYIFTPQGWIGSPAIGAVVQGPVPITLASGITLTSGTLKMFPSSNPNQVTVLNSNTTGTGPLTLATIDGSLLANSEYTIQLQATQSTGACQLNEIVVSVTGEYKPGREKVTVTDLTVQLAGIPINITRTYDSLNRGAVGDFGNGWNLSTNVQLSVDQLMNVTFTWNGKAQTFYFTPQSAGSALFPWLLVPHYTPQPGLYGTLTSNGCSALVQVGGVVVQDTLGIVCFPAGTYQPTVYTYTDPSGRVYTIASTGQLQSIKDPNGNTITITPTGITSTVGGVVVPFVRDSQGRVTQITDLNNNNYVYAYDSPCGSGNLCSVTFPGLTSPAQYTYLTDHSLATQVDPNGNTTTTVYYSSANDGGNPSLDGRIQSVTGPVVPGPNGNTQYVTQYSYNVAANSITVTNPDGGTVTTVYDSFGKPLSVTDALGRKTTYVYDSKENLVQMIDALQNPAWVYTYDNNGCQTSIQDPLGNKSTTIYNQFCEPTSITDAANTNTQTLTYDGNFNLKQITDLENGAGTSVLSATYDTLGNLLTSTDANGQTTQFEYDPRGNLIQITDPLNEVTHLGYDPMDRLVSQTDPRGNTTQFKYYPLGWLKTKTDALGNVTSYVYDSNGNKTSETDANKNTTQFQYDALNRLTKITYADNTTRQFTYDFRNNKLTEIDQAGHETFYVYDLAGELQSVTYAYGTPDAGSVQYTYDLDGKKKTVKDELGNTTTYNYDKSERVTNVQDATTNPPTVYGWDSDNRLQSVQDPNGNIVSYVYYPRNWMKIITYPATSTQPVTTIQYTYDGMGRVLTTQDQAGQVTTDKYDLVGRLTSVTDAQNQKTQYFYDLASNLQFVEDALGRFTSYQYDPLNRLAVRTLPLGMSEYRTYDPVGNLHTKQDFNGKTTTYQYDTLNRLQQRIPDASLHQTTVSFTYTPTGKRLSMTDVTGTTSYTSYDNRDRLKTKVTPEGTLNYTYDAHSNLLTIASSNTNGASMSYTYDVLNRLATAKDLRMAALGGPSTAASYGYDPAGNLTSTGHPNTMQTGNVFDTLNRLTQTCVATSAPACSASQKLASFAYTLGYAGNRTGVTELNGRNVSYTYDNDYRLKSETITSDPVGNNGAETYTYDAVGNRLTLNSTIPSLSGAMNYSYDNNDRLTTDAYDNDGNTTKSGGITNSYDFENHMLTHGSVSIAYDGDGNRVSETVGSTTMKFLVDDLNPTKLPQVVDETVNGSVTRTYAYGLNRISENQLVGSSWMPSFYGYDGHANVRFLANSSGTVTDTYAFDAFGAQIASTGTTSNPYLYSGEQFDSSTSMYQLRARWYQPTTGRFITRDPRQHSSCCKCSGSCGDRSCSLLNSNSYAYASDDPVDRIDPSGRADIVESATLYRYVLVYTAATILYYARPVKCNLVGEFADPSVDPVFKICYYSCTDGIGRSHIWPINQACPDPINAFWGLPF